MATEIPNLWPESFGDPGPPTPVAILRQQGLLLGQKTSNLVYGEVHSRATGPGAFSHTFEIAAPLLAYRHPVVVVTHGVNPYPAQLSPPQVTSGPDQYRMPPKVAANSSEEFLERLKAFFQSPETVRLLHSLVAQSVDIGAESA